VRKKFQPIQPPESTKIRRNSERAEPVGEATAGRRRAAVRRRVRSAGGGGGHSQPAWARGRRSFSKEGKKVIMGQDREYAGFAVSGMRAVFSAQTRLECSPSKFLGFAVYARDVLKTPKRNMGAPDRVQPCSPNFFCIECTPLTIHEALPCQPSL
jgi:hypothetical protein